MAESYISKVTVNGESFSIRDDEARASIADLATVAFSGSYNDLIDVPSLGTSSEKNIEFFDLAGAADAALEAAKSYADDKASGDASTAETNAKAYADSLADNYDANGAAAGALALAQSYADELAVNYDEAGSANTAETNAKAYADSLAVNYDAVGSANTAESNAKNYADGLAKNYDVAGAADAALNSAKAYTDTTSSSAASSALASAKSYTDTEVVKKATIATTLSGYGITDAINSSEKGSANGVATLGSDGLIPSSQLPSYVDDVLEFNSVSDFPEEGESGKIYIDLGENITYRWSGSTYVEISKSLAIGETSSTAYAGDKGKANAEAIAELQAKTYTATDVGAIPAVDIKSIKYITQAEYDALEDKDDTILYLVRD